MELDCCKEKDAHKKLIQTSEFLKIIAEPNRLKILCILQKEEKCVCDIWKHLNLSQNLTSHHLKILKDFELIGARHEGTKVIYSINKNILKKYSTLLNKFL